MNKISNVVEFIKARKTATNEDGFSLIELVVAVGILAILSVTGVVAYSSITENARKTATDSAAAEVYTAVIAAESDGDAGTTPTKVVADYNASKSTSSKITVTYTAPTASRTSIVTATNTETTPTYTVTRGGQAV